MRLFLCEYAGGSIVVSDVVDAERHRARGARVTPVVIASGCEIGMVAGIPNTAPAAKSVASHREKKSGPQCC